MKWDVKMRYFLQKGKKVLQYGWKIYEECFKNKDGLAIEDPAGAEKDRIPDVKKGDEFYHVEARKTEHSQLPRRIIRRILCSAQWRRLETRNLIPTQRKRD